ncbi:MAG: hypothetical protein Q4E24_01490 [bacterium]|nr:hypothetical protein [bacterium]
MGAWDWNVADYGMLCASKSDFIDCGSYYEVKNQELKAVKQYDAEFEGENAYASHRLPNGKYAWHKGNREYESTSIYTGSLYMMKDAEIINCDDSADKRVEIVLPLEEYLEKWEELPGIEQGILWGYISEENDKGYITKVQIK